MIKSKNYNNISEELIPPFGKDDVAVFRCVHISKDPSGVPIYPTYVIPSTDTIWDSVQGKFVDIAYIVSPSTDGKKDIIGSIAFERSDKCVVTLKGSSPSDVHKFHYLKMCNANASNPNRDEAKMIIYEEVDAIAADKALVETAKKEADVTNFILSAPIKDLVVELRNRNIETSGWSDDRIRAKALDESKKKPFKAVISQKADTRNLAAILQEALDAEFIEYDAKVGVFYFADDKSEVGKVWKSVQDKMSRLAEVIEDEARERIVKTFA